MNIKKIVIALTLMTAVGPFTSEITPTLANFVRCLKCPIPTPKPPEPIVGGPACPRNSCEP